MPTVKTATGMTRIWHDRFIGKLGNGAKVLDLGCGSGRPVAQHMAELGLRVTGVDSSPRMISFCRERLRDQEWIVADMRQLALGRRFASSRGTAFFISTMMINGGCSRSAPVALADLTKLRSELPVHRHRLDQSS